MCPDSASTSKVGIRTSVVDFGAQGYISIADAFYKAAMPAHDGSDTVATG